MQMRSRARLRRRKDLRLRRQLQVRQLPVPWGRARLAVEVT